MYAEEIEENNKFLSLPNLPAHVPFSAKDKRKKVVYGWSGVGGQWRIVLGGDY